MLHEETADAALQVLLQADLAGAHNYLIMDKNGTVSYTHLTLPTKA